jgi:hypothetical protein
LYGSAVLCQVVKDMGEKPRRQQFDWRSRHDEPDGAGDKTGDDWIIGK